MSKRKQKPQEINEFETPMTRRASRQSGSGKKRHAEVPFIQGSTDRADLVLAKPTREKAAGNLFTRKIAPIFLSFAIVLAGVYGFATVVLGQDNGTASGALNVAASDQASDTYALGLEAVKNTDENLMAVGNTVAGSGAAILVDGQQIALVNSESEANWVLDSIKNTYTAQNNGTLTSEFQEEVSVSAAAGDPLSREEALIKMTSGGADNTAMVNVVSTEVVETEKTVAYSTEKKNTDSLYKGESKVETKGVNGVTKTTTTISYLNGEETGRESKDTVVTAPVNQVVLVGTKTRPTSSGGSLSGGGGVSGAPSFRWPTSGRLSSPYGPRWGSFHYGIDIANSYGTPIYAAADGTVTESDDSGWGGGYGYHITIRHNGTYSTRSAHMSKLSVRVGASVSKGQLIGYLGCTGDSTGNHLHFEVIKNGSRVDPVPYLP